MKGAVGYGKHGGGEPSGARRTSLDEHSESSGISTAASEGSEERNEPRDRSRPGLSRWYLPLRTGFSE
jgi:hypothetical protein